MFLMRMLRKSLIRNREKTLNLEDLKSTEVIKLELLSVLRPHHFPFGELTLGNVSPHRPSLQGELNAIPLILVQFTILVLLFALILEGDDDEAHENVDHEEGNHNDVDYVEHGHEGTIVVDGPYVQGVRINGHVQQST